MPACVSPTHTPLPPSISLPPQVDYTAKTATLKGSVLREGDWLSLNGSTGEVLQGKQPVKAPELSGAWAGMAFCCSWGRACSRGGRLGQATHHKLCSEQPPLGSVALSLHASMQACFGLPDPHKRLHAISPFLPCRQAGRVHGMGGLLPQGEQEGYTQGPYKAACLLCPLCAPQPRKQPPRQLAVCLTQACPLTLLCTACWLTSVSPHSPSSIQIGVYTNADTPADAAIARKNGAQGIGLVRTGAFRLHAAACACCCPMLIH